MTVSQLPVGVVLVHGYLGAPSDMEPLVQALTRDKELLDCLEVVLLPGHGTDSIPTFDEAASLEVLSATIDRQRALGRQIILLGHSTGGNLILAELTRRLEEDPDLGFLQLLVLCGTPPHIGHGYFQRWKDHREAIAVGKEPTLSDIGALVTLVNRLSRQAPLAVTSPVLIIHGEADELVPLEDAEIWKSGRFTAKTRQATIPGAGHHLFMGRGAGIAIDAISRAIADARKRPRNVTEAGLHFYNIDSRQMSLFPLVTGLESFVTAWPDSLHHLLESPSGQRAVGRIFCPGPFAKEEPILANIEITTHCNLACSACARTQIKVQSRSMSRADFLRVLEALPHTFRINLVGLGEPLLHPEVVEFVRLAAATGRRVGLVTNGMLLDADLARALCASGLASITFSIDAVDQKAATRARKGSDMVKISANIHNLIREKKIQGVKLDTSVFTALTGATIGGFEAIIDFVADHEIDALMVTDLNFLANQSKSVHDALTPANEIILRQALKRALARCLPVLSVLGLEEYALDKRYRDYLLINGNQLAHRSTRCSNCLSPWQTIPVNVDGNLTICDCQPCAVIGNIHSVPLSNWWNGPQMTKYRQRMLSENPPVDCLVCPRF